MPRDRVPIPVEPENFTARNTIEKRGTGSGPATQRLGKAVPELRRRRLGVMKDSVASVVPAAPAEAEDVRADANVEQ